MALRREKKNRTAQIMIWIIALIMVASVFEVVLFYNTSSGGLSYNSFSFTQTQQGQYVTVVDGKRLTFVSFPSDVASVPFDSGIPALMKGAQIVITTFDPGNLSSDQLMIMDYIRFDLSQKIGDKAFSGVMAKDDRYPLPLITCTNASSYAPIIVLLPVNETAIAREGNCIFLFGTQQGVLRAYDRLMYGYYGIIPDYSNDTNATGTSNTTY